MSLASKTEINKLVFPDLPVEAIGGSADAVRKASGRALQTLQRELRNSPYRRVDTLMIDSSEQYSPSLLKDYINTLGVKFIVFRKNGTFDGWIEAGLFLNQFISRLNITPEDTDRLTIPYDGLRQGIVGISTKAVQATDTVRNVLREMQEEHTENLPVLESNRFKFFANRGEILANLISNFILRENKSDKSE